MWNNDWKKGEDYPSWGDNDVYKKTISGGYLYNGENPKEAYHRVSKAVANRLYKPEMAETFFNYIWNGWLCLASPVLSNTGTDRGLPISCFGIDVADSIQDIGTNYSLSTAVELALVLIKSDPLALKLQVMEHQMESYPSLKFMTQQYSQLIKDLSVEELLPLTLTLSTMILKTGLRLESQKVTSTGSRLTYINAQLLVTNLCVSLNKAMLKLGIDGANFLENEKQLENLISCLKVMLTNQTLLHINKTD